MLEEERRNWKNSAHTQYQMTIPSVLFDNHERRYIRKAPPGGTEKYHTKQRFRNHVIQCEDTLMQTCHWVQLNDKACQE